MFALPGAFTPGCQAKHLPPFIEKYSEFKSRGVDIIAVISANDAFVGTSYVREIDGCNRSCQHGLKRIMQGIRFSDLVILVHSFPRPLDGIGICLGLEWALGRLAMRLCWMI